MLRYNLVLHYYSSETMSFSYNEKKLNVSVTAVKIMKINWTSVTAIVAM